MYFTYEDTTIYYEKYGNSKKTVIILPGWGDTRNTFYNLINYFKKDYNIYIVDYPSFGNSPIPTYTLNIYDYAKLILTFMKKENIINPIIICHSFGGRIATILTGLYNLKIDKMIYIDTAGIKEKKNIKKFIKEKTYKLLKKIITKIFKNTKDEKITKLRKVFGSSDYNNLPKQMINTFNNIVNEDLKPYFKNINSEVLIIWGKKDKITVHSSNIYIRRNDSNTPINKCATEIEIEKLWRKRFGLDLSVQDKFLKILSKKKIGMIMKIFIFISLSLTFLLR